MTSGYILSAFLLEIIYCRKMNIDKSCYNSFCEPAATGRRSKKTHGLSQMHTESLTRIFLTFSFFFDAKGF